MEIKVDVILPETWLGYARYKLQEDITVDNVIIPKGYITDGATITRWYGLAGMFMILFSCISSTWIGLWAFIFLFLGSLGILAVVLFPKVGKYFLATLAHDYLIDAGLERRYCDVKFRQIMLSLGIRRWRAYTMYYAVRLYARLTDLVVDTE